jgi:hypothetical protein
MKGLLLIVGFVILSITTNAQRVFYTSGKGIAEYNADSSSGWIYNAPQPSDLKIYVGPKSITFNDEKKSTYTLVSEAPGIREIEANVESWSALDMNGKPCYITLTTYKNGPVVTRVTFFYNINDKRRIYYNATEAQ